MNEEAMNLIEVTRLPPDTSATAEEHRIGFEAGWRLAMDRVLRELASALICTPRWDGRELMIGDIVVGRIRKMEYGFSGALFNGTSIDRHLIEEEARVALQEALIEMGDES
jgi:hypothetical protein